MRGRVPDADTVRDPDRGAPTSFSPFAPLMDCSAFRRHHVAYVDDTLPGELLVAAARHVGECEACARHDTAVRRSLLLARNICGGDRLECSPDFAARLEARLRREGNTVDDEGVPPTDWTPGWREVVAVSLGGRLATPRRTRQALAAAALLAAVSTGAMFRGAPHPMQVQGLGGGLLPGAPFGSPFASVPAGDVGFGGSDAGFSAAGLVGPATEMPQGAVPDGGVDGTFAVYDGTVDAGALVAPASVGVTVWAAAVLAGEVPATLWRSGADSSAELVTVGH